MSFEKYYNFLIMIVTIYFSHFFFFYKIGYHEIEIKINILLLIFFNN